MVWKGRKNGEFTAFSKAVLTILSLCSYAEYGYAKSDDSRSRSANNTQESAMRKLTDMQEYVTQHNGTEPAYENKYWDNKEPGVYVDIISGEPLFSSTDKYDSKTGWPSFTKPIEDNSLTQKEDHKLLIKRTEVRSTQGGSHLGHVFNDGPKDKGGLRYCVNSASLRFIHKNNLKKEGYEQYLKLFK